MITLKKKVSIELEFIVQTDFGGRPLMIEINNKEIIFRGGGCRTEVGTYQAQSVPKLINNALWALLPSMYIEENASVTKAVFEHIKHC